MAANAVQLGDMVGEETRIFSGSEEENLSGDVSMGERTVSKLSIF